MASGRRDRQHPDCRTFLCKFWHFQMAVSQWKLAWLTSNLRILWISVSSFWLCESIVTIYRLVPRPSRFETKQCMTQRKTVRKKWTPGGEKHMKGGTIPAKPESLTCHSHMTFQCKFSITLNVSNRIPYLDLLTLSSVFMHQPREMFWIKSP